MIGRRFYRITAATDDGSFSVLFQSSSVMDRCRGVKIISTNITNNGYWRTSSTLPLSNIN